VKVLIVDDNDVAAELLAELLEDEHVVRTACSTAQALLAVKEEHFEVALVDVRLPEVLGEVLARQLRSALPALVLIAVTANSVQEIQDSEPCATTFSYFLQKPVHFEELAAYLRRLGQRLEIGGFHDQ